jgi:hypothetical protein
MERQVRENLQKGVGKNGHRSKTSAYWRIKKNEGLSTGKSMNNDAMLLTFLNSCDTTLICCPLVSRLDNDTPVTRAISM